ncbi:MAG: alkaline phosphatase, partial [Clostridia bacterium]|nr:alkaline phosphatase [Clostridia bacterium]
STFALNHLNGMSDNGFFLMIESSHIDKYSHSGNVEDMVKEVRAFDETVKAVIDWAKQDGNTIVIVTADHETGGLVYNPGDTIGEDLFITKEHTNVNVGAFIYGLHKKDFADVTVIDNIDINAIMRNYIINYRK